jgi:hypothetical protein
MKWIQHMTNSRRDPKIRRSVLKYGAKSYGIYWMALEIISENLDKNTNCIIEHDLIGLADEMGEKPELIGEIMDGFVECGLFEKQGETYRNPKIKNYADEWTRKKLKLISLDTPDKLPSDSNLKVREGKVREGKVSKDKAQRRPSDSAPIPGFSEFNDWWCKAWGERFGSKYDYAGAKDAKCVKSMLKNHSVEELKTLAVMGWETSDNFLRGRCSTISGFSWALPQLIAKKPKDNFEEYNRAGRKS